MSPKPSPLLTSSATLKPVAPTYFLGFINKITFIQDRTSVGLGPPLYLQHKCKYKQPNTLELLFAFIWTLGSPLLPIVVQAHQCSFVSIVSAGLACHLLCLSLLLWSTGSRRAGSVIVAHGSSCSAACGIFPDQGSNPCPLLWQADSQPLRHQGSPYTFIVLKKIPAFQK